MTLNAPAGNDNGSRRGPGRAGRLPLGTATALALGMAATACSTTGGSTKANHDETLLGQVLAGKAT